LQITLEQRLDHGDRRASNVRVEGDCGNSCRGFGAINPEGVMFGNGKGRRAGPITICVVALVLAGCKGPDAVAPPFSAAALNHPSHVSLSRSVERTVVDVSRGPLVVFHCNGFDAVGTFYGTITVTVFYDANGQPIRLINEYNTSSVIVNSVSGRRIFGSGHGPDLITLSPDGSQVVESSGILTNFRDEDGHHLIFAAGRVVQTVSSDGDVDTIFTAGPVDDYLGSRRTEVCNALAG
jgi:hypothetical protein